ncbi:uncharacterized protein PV09_08948 [Verruconis gallopava]|uniref:VLRF1 domain-containing protein n=1 Tax=Verruconis gallopava TaxID=253628 RepID=A0A0D1ZZB4_9PEZI|nr:uncharacterized protein PV09_08948 [Verruconis gallopava]KIV99409.1 hypothetical protein PV09_08948 [Verruconis gallopava]
METKPPPPPNEILSRPLYIFDLPEELLYTLTLKNAAHVTIDTAKLQPQLPLQDDADLKTESGEPTQKSSATSCKLCNLQFHNVQEQRNHARSDLHNYNLKQQLRGQRTVGEDEFEKLVEELDESISGSNSESESEDDAAARDDTLTALLRKQMKISREIIGSESEKRATLSGSPLVWFQSEKLPSNINLGIYKAIFSKEEQEDPSSFVEAIKKRQIRHTEDKMKYSVGASNTENAPAKPPHYFLLMIGGGHCAAMVVSLAPKIIRQGQGKNERQADVLAHKTFHRYTTRRKQGGSQSASDAARGAAHSAGSSLRRYNEAALTSEVRQLLTTWKELIDSAELLFIRATGNTNRQTLFAEHEGRVLRHNDPRIRGFPFSTRRATQSELMRAFAELTRVKVSLVDESALALAQEKERLRQEEPKAAPSRSSKPQKLSEEEETDAFHTSQIQSLIRRSKAPALLNYLKSNNLNGDFTFFPESANYHAPTPLHLAASLSSPALVTALLLKAKTDPTRLNGDGKTAYEIAGDRATRDAFRSARHTLGDVALDWVAAKVPSALSPDELSRRAEQERKERAAVDAKEALRRKQELERLEREAEAADAAKREQKFGKGKTLAGMEKTGADKREEESRGMTPEMRMRLEREKRARAAEERMRRLQGGT